MPLRFTKMHGLGNDFVVLDCRKREPRPESGMLQRMADRHFGIGFDQLLTVEPAPDGGSDFAYGVWNADGSSAGQCGNGVRCVAAWLQQAGAVEGEHLRLAGPNGRVEVRLLDQDTIDVDMGEPGFEPSDVGLPFDAARERYPLEIDGTRLRVGVASMGNPHALVEVDTLEAASIDRLGPLLSAHPAFAHGCNAGFAVPVDEKTLRLRVHERGAGWTLACGSGACAAVAILRREGRVAEQVRVELPGGCLEIRWPGPGQHLWMRGPAAFVYEGVWLE